MYASIDEAMSRSCLAGFIASVGLRDMELCLVRLASKDSEIVRR